MIGRKVLNVAIFFSIIFLPFDNKAVFEGTIGFLGVWILLNSKYYYKLLKDNKIAKGYLSFLLLLFIFSFFAVDLKEGLKGYFQDLLPGLIIFLAIAGYILENGEKALKRVAKFLLIPLFLFVIAGFYGFLKGTFPANIVYYGTAKTAFAGLIGFLIPFVFALMILPSYSKLQRGGLFLVFTASFVILVYSNARSTFFGLLLSGAFLGIVCFVYYFNKHRRFSYILLTGVLISLCLLLIMVPNEIWEKTFSEIREMDFNRRSGIWIGALYAIKKRPLFGYGWYRKTFSNQFDRKFYVYPKRMNLRYPSSPKSAHNIFLELAFASGFLGLIGFLIMCGLVIKVCIKNFFKSNTPWKITCLWSLIGGYLMAGQFGCFYRDYPWERYSIIAAIAAYIYKKEIER